MKYALSKGSVLRREWFGCLAFQSFTGHYWQFNLDAFDILRRLRIPLAIDELQVILKADGMVIDKNDLQEFIDSYINQGLICRQEEQSDAMIFHESKEDFRNDCLVAPSSVTIYITDFCPKHCRHCATTSHDHIDQQNELTLDDWSRILQQLREAGVLMLVISGGEPMTLPYAQRILELADKLQFGITLLTDFDEFTPQQIADLKSLKHLISIQTSLDGATAETHDFLRGKGSFTKTMRRLQMFKDAGLAFTASVAVHKKNIGELDEIAELATSFGAASIYLNAVAPYGRAKKTMQKLLLDGQDLKNMAQTCLRWASTEKVKMRNSFWKSQLSHLGDEEFNPLAGTLNAMSLGVYNLAISSKGDCYLDAKQRAEKLLTLGNITTNSLAEMWNDPRLDNLRSLYASENFAYTHQNNVETALGI